MPSHLRRTLLSSGALLFAAGPAVHAGAAPADAAPDYGDDIVRLSKIEVDPAQLEVYKALLAEEIRASLANEAGVRALYAVSDKAAPERFTILEIYENEAAYKSHLATPWFKKYKEGTLSFVKALELVDVVPLVPEAKIK